MIKLEVCAGSIESVIAAQQGGAARVELCDNLVEGGTTPPQSWIEKSIQTAGLQTFVIIRPRGGDFLYSDNEFVMMKEDIHNCGKSGAHGVVIGILTEDGKVDMDRNAELVAIAKEYGMQVTFHRAIDRTENIFEAMEDVITLGCNRILTSGGKRTVEEGKEVIKEMIEKSEGRIIILPGSGISEDNIADLARYLKVEEFHGTFRSRVETKMKFIKEGLGSYEDEYTTLVSSAEKIKMAINNANNI